jgi:outer membrane lipoprotein SlyB
MNLRTLSVTVVAASGLLLGGCYTTPPYAVYDSAPVYGTYDRAPVVTQRTEYGVVEAIDWYRDGQSTPTGLGAILGGVAGGVLGHQIGSGRGNTAATIAGAVGGALVGNQIERSHPRDRYRVVVRLDNGAALAFSEVGEGELRVGDRVRVVNNRVYRA